MERLLAKKRMTAVIFLLFIFFYAGFNIKKEFPILVDKIEELREEERSMSEMISEIETTINENVYGRYQFIDAYGYIQKALDKKEENAFEVIKDEQGKLH